VVWAVTLGGRQSLVPEAMVIVNLAALLVLGWLGAGLAAELGHEPSTGLMISLFPGLIAGLKYDLTEPVTAVLLASFLLFELRGKHAAGGVALSLGVLARESVIIVVIGKLAALALNRLRGGRPEHGEVLWSLFPLVPFFVLQCTLYAVWGRLPISASGGENAGVPFAGFVKYAQWLINARDVFPPASYVELAGVVIFVAAGFYALACERFSRPMHVFWTGAYFLLLFSLGSAWNRTFLRVFTEYFILVAFVVMHTRRKTFVRALLLFTFTWFILAAAEQLVTGYHIRHLMQY